MYVKSQKINKQTNKIQTMLIYIYWQMYQKEGGGGLDGINIVLETYSIFHPYEGRTRQSHTSEAQFCGWAQNKIESIKGVRLENIFN